MRAVGVQNVTSSDPELEELMAEEQNFRAREKPREEAQPRCLKVIHYGKGV